MTMVLASLPHLLVVPPMVVASCKDCGVAVAPMMVILSVLDCLYVQLLSTFRDPWHPCWLGAPSLLMSMLILIPTIPEPWQPRGRSRVRASGR